MDYQGLHKKTLLVTKEPLAGTNLSTIILLLKQNKFNISLVYYPRLLYSLFLATALTPFRQKEKKNE